MRWRVPPLERRPSRRCQLWRWPVPGGSGDTDVPVDVVPLDAGLSEPELLAEGIHSSHALLRVAAGPDVSEKGHAAILCFILTCRNPEMTSTLGAEQTGVSSRLLPKWRGFGNDPELPKVGRSRATKLGELGD